MGRLILAPVRDLNAPSGSNTQKMQIFRRAAMKFISRIPRLSAVMIATAVLFACTSANSEGLPLRHTGHYATVETERGTFVIELYPAVAPKTVENFEKLTNKG